jgi:hypothetical protein
MRAGLPRKIAVILHRMVFGVHRTEPTHPERCQTMGNAEGAATRLAEGGSSLNKPPHASMNFVRTKKSTMLMPSIKGPIASLHDGDGLSVSLIGIGKREAHAEHVFILPVIDNGWLPTAIEKSQMNPAWLMPGEKAINRDCGGLIECHGRS